MPHVPRTRLCSTLELSVNIFVTDEDPVIAAQSLPDKLAVKMPTESMQMLAHWTAARGHICYRTENAVKLPYKLPKSRASHPCTKWVLESDNNGLWLYLHAFAICQTYTTRYGRRHAIEVSLLQVWDFIENNWDIKLGTSWKKHTPFVQCMPNEYKSDDPIASYREFMMGEKGYAEWRYTPAPPWWDEEKFSPTRERYYLQAKEKEKARAEARARYEARFYDLKRLLHEFASSPCQSVV